MFITKEMMKILKDVQDSKDVRAIVRGIHIYKEGYVAATDANMAFVSNKVEMRSDVPDMIIEVGTVAATGIVGFLVNHETNQLVGMDKEDNPVSYIPFTRVEGQQPVDFTRFVRAHQPSTDGKGTFDPKYLKAMTVFPVGSQVTLQMGAPGTPSFATGDEGSLIIMPQNYKERELPELLRI